MSYRINLAAVLLAAAGWPCWPAAGRAAEPPGAAKPSLADLSLEVDALQTLHDLHATRSQMQTLRQWVARTAERQPARPAGKINKEFSKTLAELRQVLVENHDDERIDKLIDRVDQLREAEKIDLDDDIEITDDARELAPKLLRMLTPAQVAAYLGSFADEIPDPIEQLVEALDKVRGLKDKEWKTLREEVSDNVARLVGSLDPDEAARIGDRVAQLLIVARGLNDKEFTKQRQGLVRRAQRIVGHVGPTDVLRHVMEYHLAELLSNPRLAAALDARLK